ncbi:MAG: siphovirus Gp157 family protein [Alphaproteobacteria bacterium]
MDKKLGMSLAHHTHLLERLRAEFPDADEETLSDTVEGLSDLDDVIAAIVRSRLEDLALADALKRRQNDMQSRLTRLSQRAERKKALIVEALERSGLKKITREDFTLSLRGGAPGLHVSDETAIPPAFWRAQTPKLDRQGLLAALKRGDTVPGAALTNPAPTISLRTR